MQSSANDPLIGVVLDGPWEIVERIDDGAGAFSYVYRAVRTSDGAECAVKCLKPAAAIVVEILAEFELEGELLSELSHATNVVKIYESNRIARVMARVGASNVQWPIEVRYHLLELAQGALSELIANDPRAIDWPTKLSILRQVTLGLHQMHCSGHAHRDMKSSNVLIARGRGTRVIVSDLGRSCRINDPPNVALDKYLRGRGDPQFAPPEFILESGTASPRSHRMADLYLIGSLLCELSVGVGASALVVPTPGVIKQRIAASQPGQRAAAVHSELQALAPAVETAATLVAATAPGAIRGAVQDLVTQLCYPIPEYRDRRTRLDRKLPYNDLAWLLRRIDIIIRQLSTSTATSRRKGSRL